MKNKHILLIIFALIIIVTSCENKEEKDGVVVATVGNEKLYEHQLRSQFTPAEWENITSEQKKNAIEEWAEITVLAQEAKERGINKNKNVKFDIEYATKTILANKLLASMLENINISDDDVFEFYNLNRENYKRLQERIKIQQFVTPTWAAADSAINEYNNGEAFYTIAKNYGRDYSVDFLTQENISTYMWNYLQGMKKWNIRIIKDGNQIKVVQLLNKEDQAYTINFDSIKDSLKSVLLEQKRKELLESAIDSLKVDYSLIIY
ncbi:MAG: hypothetical protein KGY75_03380 [Candidatus Cloacimonetes bacterium]|nr:hypothetical protein [Candidatus Cloacimonadota bacterium]MBS3767151.1 hypothetical protein [Candidatus Cloacimonadota bacterium]